MRAHKAILLLLMGLIFSGAKSYRLPPGVREAKHVQNEVERLMRRAPIRKVLLFRPTVKKNHAGPWERWKAGELPPRLAAADVVFIAGKLRYVHEWDGTDIGGWEKTSAYFFRENGFLALLETQLVSKQHGMKVLVKEYFDDEGGQVERFETAHAIDTGETMPQPTYLRDQAPVYLTPDDFYEHLGGLDLGPIKKPAPKGEVAEPS
jgi:hypothetical protein